MEYTNILLVEDNKNISKVIRAYLEKEGFHVTQSFDGIDAIEKFEQNNFHLIILDLMLPKMSGSEVCSIIRSKSNIPIIMLTAKVELDDKISGLSIGADDYITKPFEMKELLYRVKALIRRSYSNTPKASIISIGENIKVYIDSFKVFKNNEEIELTTNEFKVLNTFLSNPNQVLSREQLISLSFGEEYDGYDRTIDTYIKNIRQKLEEDSKKPEIIKTIYGVGYIYDNK